MTGECCLYTPAVNRVSEVLEPDAVFLDPTGQRRRLVRNVGILVGCLLAACLAIVGFGLVTGTGMHLAPWPHVRPSPDAALPGHRGRPPKRASSRPEVARHASPTAPPITAPRAPATTAPSGTPAHTTTATQPGKGRAFGHTKSPHPRRS